MILKIHRGIHAGAEIELGDGEYNVGAAEECDVILADAGVRDHHLRLRLADGKIFVLVYEGAEAAVDGAELDADEVEIPAYAVVAAGGCAFRAGPKDGAWPPLPAGELSAPAGTEAAAPGPGGGAGADPAGSARAAPGEKAGAGRPAAKRGWGKWVALAVLAVALAVFAWWWASPGAEEVRLDNAQAILENRGFTVTRDPAQASGTVLLLRSEPERVLLSGSVDYARQVRQIETLLAENSVPCGLELVARDDGVRAAESWLRRNNIPFEVKIVGKTRATVIGYADGDEGTRAFEHVRALLAGFDNVSSEVTGWSAMSSLLTEIFNRRGLAFLEIEPAPFHVVVTGLLSTPDARAAWSEAEAEVRSKLKFLPRFVWMRPAAEYLRLARDILAQWDIPFQLSLRGGKTLFLSGYVRDAAGGERVVSAVRPLVNEWPGGSLEYEFTHWDQVSGLLTASMAANGLKDAEVTEVGEFAVYMLGDIVSEKNAAAWRRVSMDLDRALAYPPPFVWRTPPPPEDAWTEDLTARLAEASLAVTVVEDADKALPTELSLAKGEGFISVLGAVDTIEEKRRLQAVVDTRGYRVNLDVTSREEQLARAERLAADRGVSVRFDRVGPTRLAVAGYARDVEATERVFAQLQGTLTAFSSVEDAFVNWPAVAPRFEEQLRANGLGRLKPAPLDYGVEIEGVLEPAERAAWNAVETAVAKAAGVPVPVAWKDPPTPADAGAKEVLARLLDMGLDPLILEEGAEAPPFTLAVAPGPGGTVVVSGLVETVEQRRSLRALNEEGMKHVVIDVRTREEMLKQVERLLGEMAVTVRMERLSDRSLLFKGYVLDMATGDLLIGELRKALDGGFADVEEDFTYWSALRQPLADYLQANGLERLVVYPGEFEIFVIGVLAEDRAAAWEGAERLVDGLVGADTAFSLHETMPPMRPSRFASARGGPLAPPIGADGLPVLPHADSAINLSGASLAVGGAQEEEPDPTDWRMRVVAVEGAAADRRMRVAGNDRWYRQGEMLQGHLIVEIFDNGAMLLRDNNIVVYTVEEEEPEPKQPAKNEAGTGVD